MTLSKTRLKGLANALNTYKKELQFMCKSKSEQKKEYDTYNQIKFEEIDKFTDDLLNVAEDVRKAVWTEIDSWATHKEGLKIKAVDPNSNDDDGLDQLDILFLAGIVGIVNQTVSRSISQNDVIEQVRRSYNRSASHYTETEWNKVLDYLRGRGFILDTDSSGATTIKAPERFNYSRTVTVYSPQAPTFHITNVANSSRLGQYTLNSLKTIGEKYKPAMEKVIIDGAKNGQTVQQVASRLKDIVDPASKTNKVSHIYTRIAETEMADYTERAKLDSFTNMHIQQVRWITAMDSRVCPWCRPYNLQVYNITDLKYIPPLHPRCRCTLTPVTEPDAILPLLLPQLYALMPQNVVDALSN